MGYKKSDVTLHPEALKMVPSVNVKVYSWDEDAKSFSGETDYYWVQMHLTEQEQERWWNVACEQAWEDGQVLAEEIFGDWARGSVKVYSSGRSDGWAWIDGLPDFEEWDAVWLSKWRKFERLAQAIRDDVPSVYMDLIEINLKEDPEWLAQFVQRRLLGESA